MVEWGERKKKVKSSGLLMCSECLIELDKVLGKPGMVLVAHPKGLAGKVGFRLKE